MILFLFLASVLIFRTDCEVLIENGSKTLQLLHIIYRHGARTPTHLYPTDPNAKYRWMEGFGELTILGKLQHYKLGKFLKERYQEFLTDNPKEVSARSSGKSRTLESAESNLASMYPPKGKWIWNTNLNWQPIAIQTVPLKEDNLLYPSSLCPEAFEEQKRIRESPAGQKYINEHKELFNYVSVHSGAEVTYWRDIDSIFHTMSIEKENNLTVPSWANKVWNQMKEVTSLSFYWEFSTKLIQRLRAGPFLNEVITHMLQKAEKQFSDKTKVFVYSTHDTLIAAVLNALNVFNNIEPPFCSTIIFELHSDDQRNYTVQLLYLNSSKPEKEFQKPHILKLPDCNSPCPLEKFIQLTKDVIPTDWKKECGLTKTTVLSQQDIKVLMAVGIPIVILLIILIVLLLLLKCCRRHSNFPYRSKPLF